MKYNQFTNEELVVMGDRVVSVLQKAIHDTGLNEIFVQTVQDLDNTSEKRLGFQFNKDFNSQLDSEIIHYHLVCYFSALIKLRAAHFIKTKKLFRGYIKDFTKTAYYVGGIENGLLNYQKSNKLNGLYISIPQIENDSITYDRKLPLNLIDVPYFNEVDFSNDNYAKLSNLLAISLGLIREPTHVEYSGVPIQQLIENLDLNDIAIGLLEGTFIKY